MKRNISKQSGFARIALAIFSALALIGSTTVLARPSPTAPAEDAVKIPSDQLDSLVAPIALYPDNLLSQTLHVHVHTIGQGGELCGLDPDARTLHPAQDIGQREVDILVDFSEAPFADLGF